LNFFLSKFEKRREKMNGLHKEREDELIRKLFYGKVNPDEAKMIVEKLIHLNLKNGDLILLIEILHDYELEGCNWARELKLKAIRKLKNKPKKYWEEKYIKKIIEEYSR
jgi:hypothetical protein